MGFGGLELAATPCECWVPGEAEKGWARGVVVDLLASGRSKDLFV